MNRKKILALAHKTRPIVGRFELSGVVGSLTKTLESITDIDQYVSNQQVMGVVNPCELAFNFILKNKSKFFIQRGSEKIYLDKVFMHDADIEHVRRYYEEMKSMVGKGVIIMSDENDEIGDDIDNEELEDELDGDDEDELDGDDED